MKKVFVFIIALLFLIPLARTALAAPANPGRPEPVTRLPFKGTIQSTETYSNLNPNMLATATGSGEAGYIGRFAVSYKIEWDFQDLSTTGTAYFVTPNGDSLQAKVMGQAAEDRTPGLYNVVEICSITGGTGQFENARGTLTLRRQVNLSTGIASSTIEGTLLVP